jgi:hypothetical protein
MMVDMAANTLAAMRVIRKLDIVNRYKYLVRDVVVQKYELNNQRKQRVIKSKVIKTKDVEPLNIAVQQAPS